MIESEVFVSVVLRVRKWLEMMASCVVRAVVCVLRVSAPVLKMWDRIPQARLCTGCKIAGVQ